MADPFATIRLGYDQLGLELTADAEPRMRRSSRPHHKRSYWHPPQMFAYTGSTKASRERTRRYQEHFGASRARPSPG